LIGSVAKITVFRKYRLDVSIEINLCPRKFWPCQYSEYRKKNGF